MLVSDSMPLLWLIYALLSLVVLATGYMGVRFLPLLPRLALVGAVAGILWMPIRFRLPLVEEGEFYTGLAPAVLVGAISFLQRDGAMLSGAVALLLVAVTLGTAAGIGLWWLLRGREAPDVAERDERGERRKRGERGERGERGVRPRGEQTPTSAPRQRREPKLG
ncbi:MULTISPECIES: hypothetical protein [Halomonadaceae]|uniref:hypothetical protein n=1 Tax=Halomonadaceae TaxID=28256 RepID=UPI001C26EBBF|nr:MULTISPECIES: hypothetical protein [Halomonas]